MTDLEQIKEMYSKVTSDDTLLVQKIDNGSVIYILGEPVVIFTFDVNGSIIDRAKI